MPDFDYRGSYIPTTRVSGGSVSPGSTLPDGREVRRLRLEERDTEYSDRYVQELGPYTVSRVIRDEKDWAPYRTATSYSGEIRATGSGGVPGLVGLGILLEKKGGSRLGPTYVKSMIPGMAGANCSQIQVGDEVVSIDGNSCENKTLDDIKKVSLGAPGTTSTVVIKRGYNQVVATCTRTGGNGAYTSTTFTTSEYRPTSNEYRPTSTSPVATKVSEYAYDGQTRVFRDPKDWAPYQGVTGAAYPATVSDSYYAPTYSAGLSSTDGYYPSSSAPAQYKPVEQSGSFYGQNGKPLHYL